MNNNSLHTLVASTNAGRYSLDHPRDGRDLTSGDSIALYLDGHWIEGRVEASHVSNEHFVQGTYASEFARTAGLPLIGGYYFIADDGQICGLCVGMRVMLL